MIDLSRVRRPTSIAPFPMSTPGHLVCVTFTAPGCEYLKGFDEPAHSFFIAATTVAPIGSESGAGSFFNQSDSVSDNCERRRNESC
jgi:hypothetical protein